MKIIAIEGLDKSGKHTATNILINFFTQKGLKVRTHSVPNYKSPIGKLLGDWLNGNLDMCSKTFELLQAADKQDTQSYIRRFKDEGADVLVMDRYLHSMWAYGSYNNDYDWLKGLTKGMILPDTVMYLDVEPEVSVHRNGKFGVNDKYESDVERLRSTQDIYNKIFREDGTNLERIDANRPKVPVKFDILKAGSRIYEEITGIPIQGNDIKNGALSKEELKMLREWKITAI